MTVNELQVPTTHAATPAPNMNYYAAEQLKWLSDDLSTILNNSEDTDRNKKSLVKAIDEVRFIRELLAHLVIRRIPHRHLPSKPRL